MAERTNGMNVGSNGSSRRPADEADRLERRADMLRRDLDGVVEELDRRRHAAVRRLKPVVLVAAGLVVAGGVGLALWRRHRRARGPKLAPFARAVRRMRAHPERVAQGSPSMAHKVTAAALTTLASLVVKRAFAAALPARR